MERPFVWKFLFRSIRTRCPGTIGVIALAIAYILFPQRSFAQTTATNSPPQTNAPPAIEQTEEKTWSFGASVYGYFVPESQDYVQPTFTADHGMLHLEARYNYEQLKTASTWVGCNFGGGKAIEWEITPMLGGVFGDKTGIAPGYKGSLRWWKLDLYSEGEYVVDIANSSESFFYNWSELTIAPVDWLRLGLVTQRTRAYQTDRDIQRGFLAGVSFKRLDLTLYVFNPDDSRPTFVLGAAFHF